jgi:multidrug efflux pump subunit AcrB
MSAFNLSALAVRERAVTLFLIVAISIAGVVAFLMLGRAEDPSFTIKQMTVVTAWPGGDGEGDGRAGRRKVGETDAGTALV